ncbi:putative HicB family RNase H-like nuclease [Paraburkholderia atlantica]|uniref:plasmid partition protein ParG n=1 Tax=Paraburkholderia atlantica TaxID=2654982 RepID=UPI003D24943D
MSKFKITPSVGSNSSPAEKPATRQEFVSGAALVQSQAGTRPPKPVRLNLDLDPEVHRQLKMRAVESGVTIAQLVRGLIAREIG